MQHSTQELALHEQVQLTEMEIRQLCLTAKEIFMGQPNLLELEAPIKICGGWCTHVILWLRGIHHVFRVDVLAGVSKRLAASLY